MALPSHYCTSFETSFHLLILKLFACGIDMWEGKNPGEGLELRTI
jgi:hypothetical protein